MRNGKHSCSEKINIKVKKQVKICIIILMLVFRMFKLRDITAYFSCFLSSENSFLLKPTYTVTFDPNLGTGNMEEQDISYNVLTKLNQNEFTREGYTFTGWSKHINSLPSEYQEVEYLESTGTQFIDTEVQSDINIKMELEMRVLDEPEVVTTNGMVFSNYRGWLVCGSYGNNTLVSYFCDYPRRGVEINYDTNWHTYYLSNGLQKIDNNISKISMTKNYLYKFNLYLFEAKIDYPGDTRGKRQISYCRIWDNTTLIRDFVPCYCKEDNKIGMYDTVNNVFYTNQGTGEFIKGPDVEYDRDIKYEDKEKVINLGDITLYAQWEENIYNITYNLDGGTPDIENPVNYTVNTETFTLNNPSKEGYTFKGWSGTNLSGSSNKTVTVSKGSIGNREYTANFTPNIYYIKFSANGGTGSMPSKTMTYNVSDILDENIFTRAGFVFEGWNTLEDGTGISFEDKEEVINLSTKNGENVYIYAQWRALPVRYAVQVYGINQDENMEGETLGLTFGPATGADYNNAYVTHRYVANEEGTYNVEVITTVVDADGTETPTIEELVDANDNIVTRTEEQVQQRQNINLHNMSWEEIAAVEDKTLFEDCMLCGDTKKVELTLNNTIKTSNLYEQYGDGAGVLKETVKKFYRKWNPNQSDNSYVGSQESGVELEESEIEYGSNAEKAGGYSSSHIRATLIGENEKTNRGYAGDENLTTFNCIFSCIQEDLRGLIVPKKVKYVTETEENYALNEDIADKVWLFSDRELNGLGLVSGEILEGIGTNGEAYPKFKDIQSRYYMSSISEDSTNNRVSYDETMTPYSWWLRSIALDSAKSARRVFTPGLICYNDVYSEIGIAFGFCLR